MATVAKRMCTQHFVSVNDFITILCKVLITNVEIVKFFLSYKNVHTDEAGAATFLPTFCFQTANYKNLNVFLDLYPIDMNNQGQNTTAFSHKKPDKKNLTQLHFTLPAIFKLSGMTSGLAASQLSRCFKMALADVEFWVSLELIS